MDLTKLRDEALLERIKAAIAEVENLAIDEIVYENVFNREGIELVTRTSEIALLVFDIEKQEIVQWIS